MDDEQRRRLLERVNSESATVGASIPDELEVAGETVDLGEFIVETRKVPGVPSEARATLSAAKRTLRKERAERLRRLESAPLTLAEGETIAEELVGIDRALNALENIRQPDYGDDARNTRVEDYKRWVGFLDEIPG